MGIIKSKGDFRGAVIEYLLSIREVQLTIENALKSMKGPRIPWGKWMIWPIMFVAGLVYLYYNPQVVSETQKYLSLPLNQLFILGLGIIAVAGIFYARRRLRR